MLRSSKAFTLVELAIVITIIGLLIASVTVGTAVVKQSKIRSVISEMQELKSAVDTFRNTYDYLPGDFPHASFHWGVQACRAEGANATYGANGNGDDNISGGPLAAQANVRDQTFEPYAAWCHLYEAGLIGIKYIPLNADGTVPTPGKHIPKSRLSKNAGYIFLNFYLEYPANKIGTRPQSITLCNPGRNAWQAGPILTPKQAYAIDKKVDDGKPNTGFYRVVGETGRNTKPGCVVSGENEYNLGGNGVDCVLAAIALHKEENID